MNDLPEEIKESMEKIVRHMEERELNCLNWLGQDFEMNIRIYDSGTVKVKGTMGWKKHVRRIGGSLYITLPSDYCKAFSVQDTDIAMFSLEPDTTLNLSIRKPKMNMTKLSIHEIGLKEK